jgi:hypothetical protein
MDSQTLANIGLVLGFVLVGGVFAGTEIALVSLRESQLSALERTGSRGARVAQVARDPQPVPGRCPDWRHRHSGPGPVRDGDAPVHLAAVGLDQRRRPPRLGRIPEVGDTVAFEEVALRVTGMVGPRVTSLALLRDPGDWSNDTPGGLGH